MGLNPSPVYRHLQVTVISDDGWCWDLLWRKLGVLIMNCLPIMDLASVQLEIMSNYVGGLQAIPQVQDLNELISGHVCNISDVWVYFFTKIDSPITNIIVFLE